MGEILKLSSSDLKDDFDGLEVGSFLLSAVLRAFHNTELGEGLFDFATFNCLTVLIKAANELGIDATDKNFVKFALRSLSEEHTSNLVESFLDVEVKARLETEFGFVITDTRDNAQDIIEEYVSSYIY